MAFYRRIIDRDGALYKRNHYRARWQPLWAYLGLLLCSLLMILSGWSAIYDLVVKSAGVDRRDSIVDLVASYLGVSIVTVRSYDWLIRIDKLAGPFLWYIRLL